jgi:hypothetical protein
VCRAGQKRSGSQNSHRSCRPSFPASFSRSVTLKSSSGTFHSPSSSVHEKPNFIKEDAPLSTCIPPIRFPHPVTGKPAWYATRLSTFLLVSHTGEYTFVERDLWCLNEDGEPTRDTQAGQRVFRGRLDL